MWLEISEEERYSSKSSNAVLSYPSLLSDNSTSSIIHNKAEFDYIMRIILELEDQYESIQIFKRLNLISPEKVISMNYRKNYGLYLSLLQIITY